MSALELVLKDLKGYGLVNLANYTKEQREEIKEAIDRVIGVKYTPETHPVVAIDMDGTIWSDNFPHKGEIFPHAIEVINEMSEAGYDVIIWTSRGGVDLDDCRKYLVAQGLNEAIEWNEHSEYYTSQFPIQSPKIGAGVYIDDKSYGAPDFTNYWLTLKSKFLG